MKIDAGLFGRMMLKVIELTNILGYQNIHVEKWHITPEGELEFCLIEGNTHEAFRIVLPKPKEET